MQQIKLEGDQKPNTYITTNTTLMFSFLNALITASVELPECLGGQCSGHSFHSIPNFILTLKVVEMINSCSRLADCLIFLDIVENIVQILDIGGGQRTEYSGVEWSGVRTVFQLTIGHLSLQCTNCLENISQPHKHEGNEK